MFWLSYECFSILCNAFLLKSAISTRNSCDTSIILVYLPQVTISSALKSHFYTQNWHKARMNEKLSEYLPCMKLDGYSFELCHQKHVDKCHTQGFFPPLHLSTPLVLDTTDK